MCGKVKDVLLKYVGAWNRQQNDGMNTVMFVQQKNQAQISWTADYKNISLQGIP